MLSKSFVLVVLLASRCWSSDWIIRTRRHIDGSPYDGIYTQYVSDGWRRWDSEFPNGKLSLTWITDCSNHRRIVLNHAYRTFGIVPGELNVTVKVSGNSESRDTGERRDAFGFKARHVIQTTNFNGDQRTRDGWYVDLPFSIECSTAGHDTEQGFAVEETFTNRFRGQWGPRIVDRVFAISETRLDPALFRIPHGYHDENSWRERLKDFLRGP